jgi:hypothetical protein
MRNKKQARETKHDALSTNRVTKCNTCSGKYIVGNFMKHANGVKHQRFLHG